MTGRRHAAASTYAAQCALLAGGVCREIVLNGCRQLTVLCCENGEKRVTNCKHTHTHTKVESIYNTHVHIETQLCAFNETVLQKKEIYSKPKKRNKWKQKRNEIKELHKSKNWFEMKCI